MSERDLDKLIELTSATRDAALASWGELDPMVLTHLMNPTFMGGPKWPALRQAWHVVRRPGATLLASDGLADPFDDEDGDEERNGFELEVFAITKDPLERMEGSWFWNMVWQISQTVADHGGIASLLDEMQLLTTELEDVGIPDEHRARFVNDAGRVCVLLGQTSPEMPATVDGPLSPIRFVSVKLLTIEELTFVLQGGAPGRQELAARLRAQGDALVSSLNRQSAV